MYDRAWPGCPAHGGSAGVRSSRRRHTGPGRSPAIRPAGPRRRAPATRSRRCRSRPRSCPNPLPARVVQGLSDDLAAHPLAEHLDLRSSPDPGSRWRQIRVGDRALYRESVATGRDPPDNFAVHLDGLVPEGNGPRIVEHQAAQSLARAVRYGKAASERSSRVIAARMSRARGPHSPKHARADVTSVTVTLPSSGACLRIQPRSSLPSSDPLTMDGLTPPSPVLASFLA